MGKESTHRGCGFLGIINNQEDVVDLSDMSKCLEKVYSARNNKELEEGCDAWAK